MKPLLILAMLACASAGATEVADGFESGRLDAWGTARLPSPAAGSVQSATVRSGRHAALLQLSPGDAKIFGGYRAEIDDRFIARHGSEAWYRFSLLLPVDTRLNAGQGCVIAQFHDQSSELVPGRFKSDEHSPPLAFRYRDNGDLKVTVQRYKDASSPEGERQEIARVSGLALGSWHDFRVHAVWRPHGGLVEIWHRDVLSGVETKIADYQGGVGFPPASPPTGEGPYFKVGPYCGASAPPTTLRVYFDDYARSGG